MFQDFLSLIFPNVCFTCHSSLVKGEQYICTACIYKLPRTNYHLLTENPLEKRFYGIMKVKHVMSYLKFIKNGSVSDLLYKLKYENYQELGETLGRWYGKDLMECGFAEEYDLIVPVPLHKSKIRKRGYNQSVGIARGLSQSLDLPWDDQVMIRAIKNESQTKKGRIERWKNVESIFQVNDKNKVMDKRIIIVDDVLTTGATLEACGKTLYDAGCSEIGIITLAAAQ